jgi:hypothetical protein
MKLPPTVERFHAKLGIGASVETTFGAEEIAHG